MCKILAIMGVTDMELLWADVGDILGMTVSDMRAVRAAFGGLLGLGSGSRVPQELVPVLSLIHNLRQKGVPDTDIRRQLQDSRVGDAWPEEVLARMQAAATAPPLPAATPFPREEPPRVSVLTVVKPGPETSELTARELVLDLRREICTHGVEERELLHRMNQLVQRLILEVRDLRYAFLLASSRKDRKRGKRSISRLLSG